MGGVGVGRADAVGRAAADVAVPVDRTHVLVRHALLRRARAIRACPAVLLLPLVARLLVLLQLAYFVRMHVIPAGPIFLTRIILDVIEGNDPAHGPDLAPLVALIGVTLLLACILRRDRIAHLVRRAVDRCCVRPGSGRPAVRNVSHGEVYTEEGLEREDNFTEMAKEVFTEPFDAPTGV